MKFTRQLAGCSKVACLFLVPAVLGCGSGQPYNDRYAYLDIEATIPDCDQAVSIASDSRALLVNEPEALAKLPIEKVLSQLLASVNDVDTPPRELLQRLFDTNNDHGSGIFGDEIHCDSDTNFAHANGFAATCPRSEGALALSNGFFEPGDPDHFYPVAVVNRFDLMPVSATSCGEYRIVYAKRSGLTDPDNRVFLIFEASLPNPRPGSMLACRPVAEFWKSLETEPNAAAVADRLQAFFLEGLPGFGPVILASNLGMNSGGGSGYYGTTGQVRVSQHMDEHWEMRQMGLALWTGYLRFEPTTVGNNPLPDFFGVAAGLPQEITPEKIAFADDFVSSSLTTLAAPRIEHVGMTVGANYLSGESALGGSALNDYDARALTNSALQEAISSRLASDGLGADCPQDDPLTADAILRRATVQSCAGCHAPTQFLGAERNVGCGLTWPDSLGEFHIDERGTLSPALKEVFLPHRAEVLTTYLQACDEEAMTANLGGPFGSGAQTKSFNSRRTIGGSSTH